MKLNLKERAVIEYNLLWKYDSFVNLQTKESIHSKITFTQKELEGMSQYVGPDNNTYTEFSGTLDLDTELEYNFTKEEILYLADKIMVLNMHNKLNESGLSLYMKVEEIYTQFREEEGYTRVSPWKYIKADETVNINL